MANERNTGARDATQPTYETLPGNTPPVRLYHNPKTGLCSVSYGTQLETELDYADAAKALGEAILHSLACSGHLDKD